MTKWPISPAVAGLSCDEINERVRREIGGRLPQTRESPQSSLAASEDGPLWYRGLARDGVYVANGIHAFTLPPDSPRYYATPELSFVIRHLQAHGGLNISASHNPPDDNGGKFYDERGGQPVPPEPAA